MCKCNFFMKMICNTSARNETKRHVLEINKETCVKFIPGVEFG